MKRIIIRRPYDPIAEAKRKEREVAREKQAKLDRYFAKMEQRRLEKEAHKLSKADQKLLKTEPVAGIMHLYRCSAEDCPAAISLSGSSRQADAAARVQGWYVSDSDSTKFCPTHKGNPARWW